MSKEKEKSKEELNLDLFRNHFVEQTTAKVRDFAEVVFCFHTKLKKQGFSGLKASIITFTMAPIFWEHMFEMPISIEHEFEDDDEEY